MKTTFLLLCAIFGCAVAMRQQAVAVSGKLMCRNDVLDESFTNTDGTFRLEGSERELTNIDPVFKVYHDCDDGILPGQRKVKFRIPNSYISAGGRASKTFDIGILNLETIFPKEERDLL
ncbi:hypothetical protein L5515_011787 [Caenorhabditis briggsae]|uniref:Transthyretin-like family protein n=1 Tax=Caenorhabditis briggsae TaxID=6238 RepID=A0AAE9JG06_CAEBR|nr:hypothetical protein L5515_011787 [Caenorhabditis briggsae]